MAWGGALVASNHQKTLAIRRGVVEGDAGRLDEFREHIVIVMAQTVVDF